MSVITLIIVLGSGVMCKGAHTRMSLARKSASGNLTQEPGSDIFHHTRMSGFPNFARTFQYPE